MWNGLIFFQRGAGAVARHKRFILWLYLINLLIALPPALILNREIRKSVDHSLVAENLKNGFDDEWFRHFEKEASGLTGTFHPSLSGFGAVLDSLDRFITGGVFEQPLEVQILGLWSLLPWIFLGGGFITVFALDRSASREEMLAASVRFFPRFLGLAALTGACYFLIYTYLLSGLNELVSRLTRHATDERVFFLWTTSKYLLLLGIALLIGLVASYARVLIVLDNLRIWTSLRRSVGLIRSHLIPVLTLYLVVGMLTLVVLSGAALVAPGAGQNSYPSLMLGFLIGQCFILLRIAVSLLSYAGQTALAQAMAVQAKPESQDTLLESREPLPPLV